MRTLGTYAGGSGGGYGSAAVGGRGHVPLPTKDGLAQRRAWAAERERVAAAARERRRIVWPEQSEEEARATSAAERRAVVAMNKEMLKRAQRAARERQNGAPPMVLPESKRADYEAVMEHKARGLSDAAAAEAAGVSQSTASSWIRRGVRFGSQTRRTPIVLTAQRYALYEEAIDLIERQGFSVRTAAVKVGVDRDTIAAWRERGVAQESAEASRDREARLAEGVRLYHEEGYTRAAAAAAVKVDRNALAALLGPGRHNGAGFSSALLEQQKTQAAANFAARRAADSAGARQRGAEAVRLMREEGLTMTAASRRAGCGRAAVRAHLAAEQG